MIKKVDVFSLELTNSCNLDCNFCANQFMERKKGAMDIDLAKRLIKEARDLDFCDEITTNVMGEPLLYKNLFSLLKYAADINQGVCVITNGERLDEDTSGRLFEYPPSTIGISYHCNNEESFAYQRPSISYEEYKRRVLNLIDSKFRKKIKTKIGINLLSTINKPHDKFPILESMEDIKNFSIEWIGFANSIKKKYGISWTVPDFLYHGTNMLLPGFWVTLKLRYHEWAGKVMPLGTKIAPSTEFSCSDPFTQFNVLWNGDVTLCCVDYNGELVYDNVNNKSIMAVFRSEKIRKIRKDLIESRNIPQKCSICRGEIVNLDGSKYEPEVKFPPPDIFYGIKRSYFLFRRLMWQYPTPKSLFKRIIMRTDIGNKLQKSFLKNFKLRK